jgi:cytochrome P450
METSDYRFTKDLPGINQILFGTTVAIAVLIIIKYLTKKIAVNKHQIYLNQKLPKSTKTVYEFFTENYEQCLVEWCEKYPDGCFLDTSKNKDGLMNCLKSSSFKNKILLLNSIKTIKELSKNDSISNSPKTLIFNLFSHHYLSSYFRLYDSKFKEIRLTKTNGLENLILMNLKSDQVICNEIERYFVFINEKFFDTRTTLISDEIINPMDYFQNLVVNIVMITFFKSRFDYKNESESEIQQHIEIITRLFSEMSILEIFQLKPINDEKIKVIRSSFESLYRYMGKSFQQIKTDFDENNNFETLTEMLISKQSTHSASDSYSDDEILAQIFEVFMEICVTSEFALTWAIYYLAENCEIQSKIYEEIVKNIESDSHFVSLKECDKMVYTIGFINESLRLASPMSLIPRCTKKAININGLSVPAHTNVLLNVFGIHHSGQNWSEPMECKPERWLSETMKDTENFIPFGEHRRVCLGEKVITKIIFLIVTNFVKHFKMEFIESTSVKDKCLKNEGKMGIMRQPFEFKLKLKRRYLMDS